MLATWKKFSSLLVVVGLGLLLWAYSQLRLMPEQAAKEWLTQWTGTFFAVTATLILVIVVVQMESLVNRVKAMPRELKWILPGILLGSALYVAVMAPQVHRIYYDESIYLSIGQNLTHLNRAQTCHSGGEEYGLFRCEQWEYNKQPNGFPFLASVVFRIFGTSEYAVFYLNNLLLGVAGLSVLFLAYLISGGWRAGLFSALLVILIPQNLHWYNTTAAEPSSAVTAALVVLTAFAYLRNKNAATLTLLTLLFAFAIQFRPESLLLGPLVLLIVGRPALVFRKAFAANILLFGVLTLPLWLHMELFRNHPWGSTGVPFSRDYFLANLNVNGWHFLTNREFPLLITILAFCGLAWPGPRWMERGVLGIWFLLFWGVFLFFYAGSYHYGADVRYAIVCYLPLTVLGGLGAERIIHLLMQTTSFRHTTLVGILTLLLVVSHMAFLPRVRAMTDEAWAARADYQYAQKMVAKVPPESLILTHNPNMFQLWGYHAAQMSVIQSNPHHLNQGLFPRYQGGIYLHYNFWCNVQDPVQNSFCKMALEQYDHEIISEYREKDYRYTLYRLRQKTVAKPS
ncbi:MAG: hypothetical protein H7839_07780 [Magnetococcus sp. YQC-5]